MIAEIEHKKYIVTDEFALEITCLLHKIQSYLLFYLYGLLQACLIEETSQL